MHAVPHSIVKPPASLIFLLLSLSICAFVCFPPFSLFSPLSIVLALLPPWPDQPRWRSVHRFCLLVCVVWNVGGLERRLTGYSALLV